MTGVWGMFWMFWFPPSTNSWFVFLWLFAVISGYMLVVTFKTILGDDPGELRNPA
jgi:nitrate/TMAO reductase-like tetraheme cytochrome c subunit